MRASARGQKKRRLRRIAFVSSYFRDGRVVERWSQADMLGLLVQLGAVPAPA
jgi:hypothetical protein